ncbi:MAG: DUF1801 domain-containing protein, partial [Acidobacteriota bacterium]|nr:DUF1801 domain-containing protein [Acidobacteriota bacterium]
IAVYPRWVSLFFLHGAELSDPQRVLRGGGKKARHVVLETAAVLDSPAIRALIAQALASAAKRPDERTRGRIVIQSVSARQRPRRPPGRPARRRG